MHTVIPTCLMYDTDDRIELTFATSPWSEDVSRLEDLLRDRFPWATNVRWLNSHRVVLDKPCAQ